MKKFIVFAIPLLLLTSCKYRNQEQNKNLVESAIVTDSTSFFDGKTLNGWEITNFGPQGPVSVSGGKIFLGMGDGCTGITWKGDFPTMNYEVTLEAMRVAGNDFFCGITFPVGKEPCTFIVGGWGGTTVGLSSIDGLDASENITTSHMQFEKNRWYGIRLEVTSEKISAWIDSARVVEFKTAGRKLSVRPEVELSRPFGITSWNTTAAIRSVNVRTLVISNQ